MKTGPPAPDHIPTLGAEPEDKGERSYSLGEEIANAVTHGLGALAAVAALVLLVVKSAARDDALRITAFSIYGGTLILLYLASTLYHALAWAPAKRFFRRLDHAAIFLLIAGTYTPVLLVSVRNAFGYGLLALIWSLATTGVVLKLAVFDRWRRTLLAGYVLMGWLGVFVVQQIWHLFPPAATWWLVAGGLSYTGGIVFFAIERIKYMHAIWHLFVIGGSTCHFFFFYLFVLPGTSRGH